MAYRHCGGTGQYTIVTASIDGFRSFEGYFHGAEEVLIDMMNHDYKLQGYLTYVGTSSMEVIMFCI